MKRILTLAMIVVGTCAVGAAKRADTAGEKMRTAATPVNLKAEDKAEDAGLKPGGTFRPEAGGSQPGSATLPARKVAVTFDDLPAAAAAHMTGAEIDDMTARLLGTLKREKISAVGFVNEAKLYRFGDVDARIKALQMWLDDGFELGNHTYSHASLNKVGLQAWEENVIEGEPVLKLLLAQHHMTLRYFRHPYLDAGLDLNT